MEKLFDTLKAQAESLHACKKALRNWPTTPQGLIDRWLGNIDFVLDNDFPSVEFIEDNFNRELLHENLIYVNEHIALPDAPSGVYVLNGECSGTLRFAPWATATIYVRHNTKVHIIAEEFTRIFVRLYDDSDAEICDLGGAVVKVYDRRK